MAFVDKRPTLFATLAVLSTAVLLLAGNGMNPLWPVMWIAPIPVLLLAAETTSWRVAAGAAALSMLLGSLTMLYYLHFVLHAPVTAWLIPFSIASLLFAAGVLLFRGLLHRGAVFSAVIALPAFWTVCEYLASFAPANGTAGSLAYTQERFLPILQVASVTGPWGITFLLLLFPSAVASGLYLRGRRLLEAAPVVGSALAVLAGAVLFGAIRLAAPNSQQNIKVGLLDTDTVVFADEAPEMEELIKSYAEQAERLARQGAKIVLMPEKTGLLLDRDTKIIDSVLQSVADRTGATLLIGVLHVVARDSFNEARISFETFEGLIGYTPAGGGANGKGFILIPAGQKFEAIVDYNPKDPDNPEDWVPVVPPELNGVPLTPAEAAEFQSELQAILLALQDLIFHPFRGELKAGGTIGGAIIDLNSPPLPAPSLNAPTPGAGVP